MAYSIASFWRGLFSSVFVLLCTRNRRFLFPRMEFHFKNLEDLYYVVSFQ